MQNETILALLENIKKHQAEHDCIGYENYIELTHMADALKAEIRKDNAKKDNKIDLFKACMNVIKNAPEHDKKLAGATAAGGFVYVCDGSRIIRTAAAVDLPMIGADIMPLNFEKMWSDFRLEENDIVFALPTAAELKSKIKLAKAANKGRRGVRFVYGLGGLAINPAYLLDAITATGATEARTRTGKNGRFICPVYFAGENAEAVVLPVNTEVEDGEIKAVF